ncbi:glutaredoxin (plasmid) [Acaryochloris sp. 'Moss Beach']|uniref:glutaredoxin family protein n=1 Tax=Acaryochloris sp. 'Moss Beach' TaxID=2740837 RepID=UPI001F2BF9D2|nr:glutaredoxin [Acaryochloris sp. 'Moss Beach']UJB72866.1 glutaredoxin [Acaryochloris sp. 'Moss Beach']
MTTLNTTQTTVRLYRMSTPDHDCPWGLKAINLLNEQSIEYEDHQLRSMEEVEAFKAKYDVPTTPQIFFGEERIGGYTDLAQHFGVEVESADYSYTPVIVLFSTAGLITLATSLGMTGFMGVSLSMLASLKLMDLDAFVEGFQKYDLITKTFKPYGRTYPFAELLIGLGFLSGVAPLLTGISSLLIGVNGAISVFKAVYIDKLALNCACVGGNTKTPLGIISFAENALMAGMGAFLIFAATTEGKPESTRLPEPLPSAIVQLHNEIA